MTEALLANEPIFRVILFLGSFIAIAAWETLSPRRARAVTRTIRWPGNLGIVALNTALLRVIVPITAVGVAALGETHGWGLLNSLSLAPWTVIIIALVALDFAVYLQHLLFHLVPILWRIHRMHHTDLDFDVTTGARFHPIEILLSMFIKFAVIIALGPPAIAVLLFEVILSSMAVFNHANVNIPLSIDRLFRRILVTPDMHRVHHSVRTPETHSNFGFNLSVWDRLFRTYQAQPIDGHIDMTIGIGDLRTIADLRLDRMLTQPLTGNSGGPMRLGRIHKE